MSFIRSSICLFLLITVLTMSSVAYQRYRRQQPTTATISPQTMKYFAAAKKFGEVHNAATNLFLKNVTLAEDTYKAPVENLKTELGNLKAAAQEFITYLQTASPSDVPAIKKTIDMIDQTVLPCVVAVNSNDALRNALDKCTLMLLQYIFPQ